MKKLVSKQPILRFKLGNKILKFQTGKPVKYAFKNGKLYAVKNDWFSRLNAGFSSSPLTRLGNELLADKVVHTTSGVLFKWKGLWYNEYGDKVNVPAQPSKAKPVVPKVENSGNRVNKSTGVRSTGTKSTLSALPYDPLTGEYGYAGDIERGWHGTKGVIDDESLAMLREMGIDKTNAGDVLNYLNTHFGNVGMFNYKLAEDNAWGNLSKNALKKYYDVWKSYPQMTAKEEETPIKVPEFKPTPITLTPLVKLLTEPQVIVPQTINVPKPQYNRSQIRQLISDRGYDPYQFTGYLRKQLRKYLNGELDTTPDFAFSVFNNKKGGTLISKNPIKRFKKKVHKGQLGLITSILLGKNKSVEKSKDEFGNDVVTTTVSRKGRNPFKTTEAIKLEVVYNRENPELNDTSYTYVPEQYISLSPNYEVSNNWPTMGASLRRPRFEKHRNIFNKLNGTPSFKKFKNGGNIPKLQTAWSTINWNQMSDNNFAAQRINAVKQDKANARAELALFLKADNRANRGVKSPILNNDAKLLDALWKVGAFKGLKDRHGRTIIYDTAVDGIFGEVSNQALENAKKMGYVIDRKAGTVTKPKKFAYGKTSVKTDTQNNETQASTFSFDNLKKSLSAAFDKLFKEETDSTRRYDKSISEPYSLKMDRGEPLREEIVYPDGFIEHRAVEGPDGQMIHASKVGNLGLFNRTVNEDGSVCYLIRDDKGNIVTECAQTGNLISRALGRPTTDNAWTRHGVYGDTLVYGEADHNKVYTRPVNKLINGLKPEDIDPDNLQSGDFVDLYTEGSLYNTRAAREGRGNSHTGTVFKPYGETGPAYIIHNIHGKVFIDPISKFGPTHSWAILGVRRPGTKEHPYYE